MNLFSITTLARTYVRTHKYIIFSRAYTNVLQNNVHVVETHTRIYNIMHTRRTLTPVSRDHNDRGRLVVLVAAAAALHDYQCCIQQIGNLMKQRESLAWHGALASSPPPRTFRDWLRVRWWQCSRTVQTSCRFIIIIIVETRMRGEQQLPLFSLSPPLFLSFGSAIYAPKSTVPIVFLPAALQLLPSSSIVV